MNKYEKKATLIVLGIGLLLLLYIILLCMYPLPISILTLFLPVIYVLSLQTLNYWEELVYKFKQQDK